MCGLKNFQQLSEQQAFCLFYVSVRWEKNQLYNVVTDDKELMH